MAVIAIDIPVSAGGTTQVRVDCEVQRSGSSNDRVSLRVVRRVSGQGDVVLPSSPQFVLPADRDVRGWTFLDTNTPSDGVYTYVLQLMKIAGGGTFYAMNFTGVHYRR